MSNLIKRTLPVILVLAVTISCLISPAVAASNFDSSNLLPLLEYSTANDSGSNRVTFTGDTSVYFENPFVDNVPYIDMLVYMSGPIAESVSAGRSGRELTALTMQQVSGRIYRIYGSLPNQPISTLEIFFDLPSTSSTSYYTFYSINLGFRSVDRFPVVSSISVSSLLGDQTIRSDSEGYGSVVYYKNNDNLGGIDEQMSFYTRIYPDNFYLYDYLEIVAAVNVLGISSVSCYLNDGTVIPFTSSIIENVDQLDDNYVRYPTNYMLNLQLDLTGISRDPDTWLVIDIAGSYNAGIYTAFTLMECQGLIKLTVPNQFRVFWTDLISTLNGHFSNLSTWIITQTSAIQTQFTQLKNSLSSWFSTTFTKLDALINGSAQDQTNADNFNNSVDDQQQELEDMAGVMDSVTRPPLDDVDVNFDQYVSQDDISGMTSPLEALFTGDIFGVVLIMSIMMGTVSFVFYGKR